MTISRNSVCMIYSSCKHRGSCHYKCPPLLGRLLWHSSSHSECKAYLTLPHWYGELRLGTWALYEASNDLHVKLVSLVIKIRCVSLSPYHWHKIWPCSSQMTDEKVNLKRFFSLLFSPSVVFFKFVFLLSETGRDLAKWIWRHLGMT